MRIADVFLSYARPSLNDARRIADCLSAAGYSVWYDVGLPAHRDYTDVISEELDAASSVLVLWSKEAVASQWVRSEANRARETGRLVQLRLDDARLPMPFDQIHCSDLRHWHGNCQTVHWSAVIESIAALTGAGKPAAALGPSSGLRRRNMVLGGGAALLAATAGYVFWRGEDAQQMTPEAQLLLQKGMDALQANDALDPDDEGSTAQAIALLTDATRLAPQSDTAWGALSLAYAVRHRSASVEERPGLEARGRAAAETALRLDPDEPRALAALQLMSPVYRNWLDAEQGARRALARNPKFPILLFVLSDVLGSVGRWREATELSNRLDRTKFLLPGAERKAIINLWSAGDLQGADHAIKAAVERWPKQRQIWRTRIAYLLYSGRADEALSILRDSQERPLDVPAELVDAATATAEALVGHLSPAEAVAINLAYLKENPRLALPIAQACTAMGDPTTSLALLEGYFFARGEWAALTPPGGDSDKQTSPLFQPPMRALWKDSRFVSLIQRIGLWEHWQATGTRPDYLKG